MKTIDWKEPRYSMSRRRIALEAEVSDGYTIEIHHNGFVCLVGPGGGNLWGHKAATVDEAKAFAERRMS